MSTYNPSQPSTSFIGNDDFKWWLGTVKNADDKDAKLGRVKVNILGYHRPDEKPSIYPGLLYLDLQHLRVFMGQDLLALN